MAILALYKSILESARDRASLSDEELAFVRDRISEMPAGVQRIEMRDYPLPLLRKILEDHRLRPEQRASLGLFIHGMRDVTSDRSAIYDLKVANPIEFIAMFSTLGQSQPNAELPWNDRWYPVILASDMTHDERRDDKRVFLQAELALDSYSHTLQWYVDPAMFLDEEGRPSEVSILDVIQQLGFRAVQIRAVDHNIRLQSAERLAALSGTQVWIKGSVADLGSRFWFGAGLNCRPLGTLEVPRRAVLEPKLEGDNGGYYRGGHGGGAPTIWATRLPLVRVFSLDFKSYVYVDVDDLETYEYDTTVLPALILPSDMKSVLKQLFETPTDALFGDVIRGKHGGIVILACGEPGVGKTMTAEAYAEVAERPLYVLELGELGTSVEQVEHNLAMVFARVVRWSAVLQFDECDIFLSQRGDDLVRSAIVGIFLRMLDYYEGLLFLTTNRPETLDHAIHSRVMLRLDYPSLQVDARAKIWETMFSASGMRLTTGTFADLGVAEVNGRQIRNLVRLARILHPDATVSIDEVLTLIKLSGGGRED